MSTVDAALGILRIVNNNMALAINANSVAKGVDPRDFTLMGFGGAGPLHAVALAEMIHAKDVISPLHPGITAAMGLLVTELRYEYTRSVLTVLTGASEADYALLNRELAALEAEARAQLSADGIPPERQRFTRIAECRYVGQGFELRAELPREKLSAANIAVAIDNFYAAHRQVYGHAFDDQKVEVITLRGIATAAVEPLRLPDLPHGGRTDPADARAYVRDTIFDDGSVTPTPRYLRARLLDGDVINGPALIVQHNSTTLLPPGYRARVLSHGDLHISPR